MAWTESDKNGSKEFDEGRGCSLSLNIGAFYKSFLMHEFLYLRSISPSSMDLGRRNLALTNSLFGLI